MKWLNLIRLSNGNSSAVNVQIYKEYTSDCKIFYDNLFFKQNGKLLFAFYISKEKYKISRIDGNGNGSKEREKTEPISLVEDSFLC